MHSRSRIINVGDHTTILLYFSGQLKNCIKFNNYNKKKKKNLYCQPPTPKFSTFLLIIMNNGHRGVGMHNTQLGLLRVICVQKMMCTEIL
ncbi:hypothetical protein GDO86_013338 [Hymenochirus boettgeri]|uniref:Uncharacterized protein n=1 Tax=Hymenochirus boettgeri TaxID=247094 RepID=A0A8T2IQV7_9PIPI|nr:hypothetical protein GDO86_013338 [Hymenochirus boettgeri]